MRFVSTRGRAPGLDFAGALLEGLARDGGLYVPEVLPKLPGDLPSAYIDVAAADKAMLDRAVRHSAQFIRAADVEPLIKLMRERFAGGGIDQHRGGARREVALVAQALAHVELAFAAGEGLKGNNSFLVQLGIALGFGYGVLVAALGGVAILVGVVMLIVQAERWRSDLFDDSSRSGDGIFWIGRSLDLCRQRFGPGPAMENGSGRRGACRAGRRQGRRLRRIG